MVCVVFENKYFEITGTFTCNVKNLITLKKIAAMTEVNPQELIVNLLENLIVSCFLTNFAYNS